MKRNFIYILGIMYLLVSCAESNFKEDERLQGDDVLFSASLKKAMTRTLYDEKEIESSTGSVKVNWVHEDLISVYGAHCNSVKQAEYKVGTVSVDDDNNPILNEDGSETPISGQNFANYLNKTGAAGVQWGNATESDFYAVYPSTSNSFIPIENDPANGVSVVTSIRTRQTNTFKKITRDGISVWVGTPYVNSQNNPTMPDAVMYAATYGASVTDPIVDLKFKPFSTVLKFTFDGVSYSTGGAPVTITQLTLTAPNGDKIAGDFDLSIRKTKKDNSYIPTASATPLESASSTIDIFPSSLTIASGEKVEFCVYTIPQDYIMNATDKLWTVTIKSSRGNFTYKMRPAIDQNYKLIAGEIHNVNIPVKQVTDPTTTLPPENWMEYIPRNVYLSELSLPGAWYSTNSSYQGSGIGLTDLYNSGVRAFHIDCRLTYNSGNDGEMGLYCAGTEESSAGIGITSSGRTVLDALQEIAGNVSEKEYVVVVLTIAENPKTDSGATLGSVDPSLVLPEIYTVLSENKDTLKLYYQKTVIDEEGNESIKYGIDANTLVYDVLNHMVVKINVNTSDSIFPGYISNYQTHVALLSEGSMSSSSSGNITAGNFTGMNSPYMYWGSSKIGETDYDIENPTMKYYYHQGQRTTDDKINSDYTKTVTSDTSGPTFDDRITAISSIVGESKNIYMAGNHNGWFQIGVGGTVKYVRSSAGIDYSSEVHGKVASVLNNYLIEQIDIKLAKNEPSPLGIVLMNFCALDEITETYWKHFSLSEMFQSDQSYTYTTYGPELVQKILDLNTLFYLNRNHNEPEWPEEDTTNPTPAPAKNAAYAVVGDDAF